MAASTNNNMVNTRPAPAFGGHQGLTQAFVNAAAYPSSQQRQVPNNMPVRSLSAVPDVVQQQQQPPRDVMTQMMELLLTQQLAKMAAAAPAGTTGQQGQYSPQPTPLQLHAMMGQSVTPLEGGSLASSGSSSSSSSIRRQPPLPQENCVASAITRLLAAQQQQQQQQASPPSSSSYGALHMRTSGTETPPSAPGTPPPPPSAPQVPLSSATTMVPTKASLTPEELIAMVQLLTSGPSTARGPVTPMAVQRLLALGQIMSGVAARGN